jgi:hypothetical protein
MTPVTYLAIADLPVYLFEQHGMTGRTGDPLTESTVRSYHDAATKRRKDGCPRPGDFPEPDHHFGRTPVWSPATVDTWATNRPGRGAGGGRPRKDKRSDL